MPNVKIIDAATWAALTEISLEEGEDLALKGIPSDTYRCIRSDVASVAVVQSVPVGVEMAVEVGTPAPPTITVNALLQEDGFNLLTESGDRILLEA